MFNTSLSDELGGTDALFREVADTMSANIAEGVYKEGEKVPSASDLARMYSINIATAGKGLRVLQRHGVLEVRRGIGFFVAPHAREIIRQERRRVFKQRFVTPLAEEAARLEMPIDEVFEHIRRAIAKGPTRS